MGWMFKNKSMLSNFIRIFVILIVIPIFCINIVLNQNYERALMNSYSEKVLQSMEQMSFSIDEELKRVALFASTIAHDEELTELVTQWSMEDDKQKKFDLSLDIDSKLHSLFNYNGDVTSLIFFLKGRGYYYFNNTLSYNESVVREMPWYKQLLEKKGKVVQLGTTESISRSTDNSRNLAVGICPDILNNTSNVEAIYLEVRTTMFNSIYSNYNTHQFGDTLIIDSEGEIVVSSDKTWLRKSIDEVSYLKEIFDDQQMLLMKQIKDTNEYVSTYFSNKSKWMVVNITHYNILTQDMKDVLFTFTIVYIIVMALFIVFSITFFREMIVPIKNLVAKMKSVEKGDFNDQIEVKGPREIRELNYSYNQMIHEIKNLIHEIDLKEKERSREEIKALQAQINPHFIYNTINSIRLMAMMSKAEGIKNMTDAFMKLISTTFKDENALIPISEELEYIENYVYIMQVRYGQHFSMELFIDDEIQSLYVIKMILQPIVENAILHGLSSMEEGGKISVKGFSHNGNVIIEVTDNGIGMTKEDIYKIMNEDTVHRRSFNHIGIMNVDRRIKLNFGEAYGLSIESEYGRYTTVRIILPKIEGNEEANQGGLRNA